MYQQSHHWGNRRAGIHTLRKNRMIINLSFLQSNQIFSTPLLYLCCLYLCLLKTSSSLWFFLVHMWTPACTLRLAAGAEKVKVSGRFATASADSSLLWRWLLWNCGLCFWSLSGYLFFSKLGGPRPPCPGFLASLSHSYNYNKVNIPKR